MRPAARPARRRPELATTRPAPLVWEVVAPVPVAVPVPVPELLAPVAPDAPLAPDELDVEVVSVRVALAKAWKASKVLFAAGLGLMAKTMP